MNNMKKTITQFYLSYLRISAKIQLKKIHPLVIGVGGASGKSSAVYFISLILGEKYKVKQGKGKNSETGLPLSILDIKMDGYGFWDWIKVLFLVPVKIFTNFKKFDVYVAEMGIDSPKSPKNMEYLLKIVNPQMGILTNINLEHSFNFDSIVKSEDINERRKKILELTIKEEGSLLKSIPESGTCFINLDDENIEKLLPLKSKIVTVSEKRKDADFFIEKINTDLSSFSIEFLFLGEKYSLEINQPLPLFYGLPIIFSIAIGFSFGFSVVESIEILNRKFSLPPGRFSVFKGIKNTTIIDSSYNSSLEATTGALEMVPQISESRRKVGVLGDMRELGSLSKIQHELMAREIPKNLDFVILIGPMTKSYVAPVLERSGFAYKSFESYKEAKAHIEGLIKKDDVVLVKGSQNTLFLERVVEMLLLDSKDSDKLCRRGKFWDVKRKQS